MYVFGQYLSIYCTFDMYKTCGLYRDI